MKHLSQILLIILFGVSTISSKSIFVSPNGNDQNDGLTRENPLKTINFALGIAKPGDKVRLLQGVYFGKTIIQNTNGLPDLPIKLMSDDIDPANFAIIDGQAQPASNRDKGAFTIKSSSWLVFKNLKIQNCWTDVVLLSKSSYISFIGCIFNGGRRVIYPQGKDCHHFLIEKCVWDQGEHVWKTFDWEEMHHGSKAYYNGALFHPSGTSGGFVMRWNRISNVFNAFRSRADGINEDCNGEIYGNVIQNVADNDFEPEGWAWNIHYYHNQLHNIHKMYSIDDVRGGPLYIYGNTITESRDANALEKVSGILKFKDGPLTQPCYVFNNSYYTEAKVLKSGEGTNRLLKHLNNAYYFFQGSNRFQIVNWHASFEFDYDCINQSWPGNIINNAQEQHGIANYEGNLFLNAAIGDFRLEQGSRCIDAGKVMSFPEFDWIQSFNGDAPDIGAYEGEHVVEGPPFQFREPPDGCRYLEKPRIVRHRVDNSQLTLYFSTEIDPKTVDKDSLQISMGNNIVSIRDISFPNKFEMVVHVDQVLIDNEELSLYFVKRPIGTNDERMVHWAATIKCQKIQYPSVVENAVHTDHVESEIEAIAYPNPFNSSTIVKFTNLKNKDIPLCIYDIRGRELKRVLAFEKGEIVQYRINAEGFSSGIYFAVLLEEQKNKAIKLTFIE